MLLEAKVVEHDVDLSGFNAMGSPHKTLFNCSKIACYCGSSVRGKLDWSQGDNQV